MKNIRQVFLLILLFLFISQFTILSYAQSKESWLKLERNGNGYGYDRIVVERLDNGNIKYQIREHIKTDIAGFNPQDIIQDGFYVVDSNMRPVAIDLHIKFQNKNIHVAGQCKDNIMRLTRSFSTGEVARYDFPFHDVYFEVVLGNVIFRKRNQRIFKIKVFSPIELKVSDFLIEVTRMDDKGIEAVAKERITMKYHMDTKGRVKQIDFVELNSRSYVTTEKNARKIDYLNTADGFTLTVKSQQSFPDVYKVAEAQFQIRWKKIPFQEFRFDDNRQQLISQTQENREYEAILEFKHPLPFSRELSLPFDEERFALFLGDTELIKPSDPLIQKQLSQILEGENDAFTVVHLLLLWVYDNIKTEYVAETLSGPDVLKRKTGKCSEYTSLFASLARAAGIPTRVAFGEALNGEKWIGHLWCEVWLGEWIAVDAASGTFVTSPTHIKLVHSPDILGTQVIRWKLVDNLSIEILDYKD